MKTLNSSWKKQLTQTWNALLLQKNDPPRLAIMGVGNDLRGDDGAGVEFIRVLRTKLTQKDHLLLIEACTAPENFSGVLRRFLPDILIIIDAVHLRSTPGTIAWVDVDEIDGFSASTHMMPLSLLAKYITAELGCPVYLLGIQAKQLDWSIYEEGTARGLSPEVLAAVSQLVESFIQLV
jgi:hydrogenase 3 maturation protease